MSSYAILTTLQRLLALPTWTHFNVLRGVLRLYNGAIGETNSCEEGHEGLILKTLQRYSRDGYIYDLTYGEYGFPLTLSSPFPKSTTLILLY